MDGWTDGCITSDICIYRVSHCFFEMSYHRGLLCRWVWLGKEREGAYSSLCHQESVILL